MQGVVPTIGILSQRRRYHRQDIFLIEKAVLWGDERRHTYKIRNNGVGGRIKAVEDSGVDENAAAR